MQGRFIGRYRVAGRNDELGRPTPAPQLGHRRLAERDPL